MASHEISGKTRVVRTATGTVPLPAKVLGAAGLLPFIGTAGALWIVDPEHVHSFAMALIGYAAVILSFLGAVYWGVAMGAGRRRSKFCYTVGVLPALVGWSATLLHPVEAGALLIAGFVGVLALDLMAVNVGLVPGWYPRLRLPLTAVAIASLIAGVAAAGAIRV